MIQDIYPHVYHNEYHPRPPKPSDYVLDYSEKGILLRSDKSLVTASEVTGSLRFLFSVDDTAFFLGSLNETETETFPLSVLRSFTPSYLGFAAITGWQLWHWYRKNHYCGQCGHVMEADSRERAMRCPECGNLVYPVISPAVIVGVLNEKNEILVTRYASSRGNSRGYALVAGYAEIGEPVEDTVRREVMEETGLTVTNLRYYKSQPWSFSETLLFGFWCDADSSQQIQLDHEELSTAIWKKKEDLEPQENMISLTAEMIDLFRRGGVKYGQ